MPLDNVSTMTRIVVWPLYCGIPTIKSRKDPPKVVEELVEDKAILLSDESHTLYVDNRGKLQQSV